jgi:hypothetical protein
MSRTRTASLAPDTFPDAAAINQALQAEKLRLTVDAEWSNREHEGYVPSTLDGEDAGFELKRTVVAGGQLVLSLRWGGDVREQAALLGVSFVLASRFGATVADPETGETFGAEQLGRQYRELIESMNEIEG